MVVLKILRVARRRRRRRAESVRPGTGPAALRGVAQVASILQLLQILQLTAQPNAALQLEDEEDCQHSTADEPLPSCMALRAARRTPSLPRVANRRRIGRLTTHRRGGLRRIVRSICRLKRLRLRLTIPPS